MEAAALDAAPHLGVDWQRLDERSGVCGCALVAALGGPRTSRRWARHSLRLGLRAALRLAVDLAGRLMLALEAVRHKASEGLANRPAVGSPGLKRPSRTARRTSSRLRAAGYRTSRLWASALLAAS